MKTVASTPIYCMYVDTHHLQNLLLLLVIKKNHVKRPRKSREITGVALQQYTNGGAEKEGQYFCQSL